MAWGGGGWAATPWGASASAGAEVRLAIVSARNAIDVEFTGPVSNEDATIGDDGLNPDNWTLTAVTFGASVPRVQHVEAIDDGLTMRVFFDADLDDGAAYNIEIASTVLDATGVPVASPYAADAVVPLLGFVPVLDRLPRELRTDFRSTGGAKPIFGPIRFDETGDLANESGLTYLKKRILRRVATARGAIFHLPNYGAGRGAKKVLTPAFLASYRADVKAQVLLEPDVLDAVVTVQRLAVNIIRVGIRPTTVQGEVLPEITTTVDTEMI